MKFVCKEDIGKEVEYVFYTKIDSYGDLQLRALTNGEDHLVVWIDHKTGTITVAHHDPGIGIGEKVIT